MIPASQWTALESLIWTDISNERELFFKAGDWLRLNFKASGYKVIEKFCLHVAEQIRNRTGSDRTGRWYFQAYRAAVLPEYERHYLINREGLTVSDCCHLVAMGPDKRAAMIEELKTTKEPAYRKFRRTTYKRVKKDSAGRIDEIPEVQEIKDEDELLSRWLNLISISPPDLLSAHWATIESKAKQKMNGHRRLQIPA